MFCVGVLKQKRTKTYNAVCKGNNSNTKHWNNSKRSKDAHRIFSFDSMKIKCLKYVVLRLVWCFLCALLARQFDGTVLLRTNQRTQQQQQQKNRAKSEAFMRVTQNILCAFHISFSSNTHNKPTANG